MKRASPEVQEEMAQISRGYPRFMEWLRDAWQQELEQLPMVVTNTAVSQGRCQVLGDLYRKLLDAPEEHGKAVAAARNAHR